MKRPFYLKLSFDVVILGDSYEDAADQFSTLVSRTVSEGKYQLTEVGSLKHLSELTEHWDENSVPIDLHRPLTLGDLLPIGE